MKENAIKALIDARTIEAIKKQVTNKLSTIAQYMGSPIMGEYSYSSILPDFWEFEMDDPFDADRIRDANDNMSESNLGWSYDSLRHGINFEIIVRTYADKITLVRATYNGNAVYLEEDGILRGYAPNYTWEQHMEDLYAHAHKLEKAALKKMEEEEEKDNKRSRKTFFEKLKWIWGYG
jgi:hypothetical protein